MAGRTAKINFKTALPKVGGIVGGSVAANFIEAKSPIKEPKAKGALSLVLGVALLSQKGIMSDVGCGMIASGGTMLAQANGVGVGYTDDYVMIGQAQVADAAYAAATPVVEAPEFGQ